MSYFIKNILCLLSFLTLMGCSSSDLWLGTPEPDPIPGERINVFSTFSHAVNIPPANVAIAIPEPLTNSAWNLEGGNSKHHIPHPAFDHQLDTLWQIKVARPASKRRPFHIQPVAQHHTVYIVDTRYRVVAVEMATGRILWHQRLLVPPHDLDAFGGGMAILSDGKQPVLFICTGYGTLEALDLQNGKHLWHQQLPQACHAPPVGNGELVFVSLIDNALRAFRAKDGRFLWHFSGTPQITRLLGTAAPAVDNSLVYYPLSSGELVAIDAEKGQTLWGDFLIRKLTSSTIQNLDDLRANPVVDEQQVYAIASSGTTVALQKNSGKTLWKAEIPGLKTPWVAGNGIFILSGNQFIALHKLDGSLFWQTFLPSHDLYNRKVQHWHTPILAGSLFYILNHNGALLTVNAITGSSQIVRSLKGTFDTAPIIVNRTMLFLSREGILSAMK